MAIRIVRLGSPRNKNEGVRIGTVRYPPPRGVPRKLHSRLDFYDVRLPELSPSASLQKTCKKRGTTATSWRSFKERFRKDLRKPPAVRIVRILAALSRQANFSIGC